MSADNRSVATDALATLGTIHTEPQKRDAIHLAVIQMVAAETLRVGDHVTKDGVGVDSYGEGAIGIVDPFLRGYRVNKGDYFWCVIYPRVITSLRHVWAHPAFPDEPVTAGYATAPAEDKKAASEKWLREFCAGADCPGYEAVIGQIMAGNPDSWGDDEYLHFDGSDAHGEIPDEFWTHVENVLGHPVATKQKYFSCSC